MRIYIAGKISGLPRAEYQERFMRAHYTDLAEQGRLIELPVPLGTTVYIRHMDCDTDYKKSHCTDHEGSCDRCPHRVATSVEVDFEYGLIPLWGNVVFATKEEAEKSEESK